MAFTGNSIVGKKSYDFALEIIKLYKYLTSERKDYVLSKQILRSGTSIGANIKEGLSAESKKDFIHKFSIALKESNEVVYWLNLLLDSQYIAIDVFMPLNDKCEELIKMLTRIIITTKQRYLIKKKPPNHQF